MAITFSKSLSELKLLNTYNNNVVEFTSDAIPGGESIDKCVISIGSKTLTITPNTSNLLRFNFKEVIKVLLDNKYADTVVNTGGIDDDSSLKGSFTVTYTITFTDETTENTNKTYVFLKSVEQIANVSTRLLTEQQILTNNNLTFFNGFPFDIGHYSDGNVTINNLTTGISTSAITSTATNTDRIFFSSDLETFKSRAAELGATFENNPCWTEGGDLFLLEPGFNTVTLVAGTTITMTIFLEDIDCGGSYLKWFNRDGGFSYWLFHPVEKDKTKTKTIDTYNQDFETIDDTLTVDLITGKESVKTRTLHYDGLTSDQRIQINDILTSPRVELYNGSFGDFTNTYQTVKVVDGSFETNNTKRSLSNIKLSIRINDYTQI